MVDQQPGQEEHEQPEERRYPSTIGGAIYLGILALAVVGVVIATTGRWRGGVHCLAAGLILAAITRLILPRRDAGMLAVRNRFFDAALTGSIGVALWVLATTLPAL